MCALKGWFERFVLKPLFALRECFIDVHQKILEHVDSCGSICFTRFSSRWLHYGSRPSSTSPPRALSYYQKSTFSDCWMDNQRTRSGSMTQRQSTAIRLCSSEKGSVNVYRSYITCHRSINIYHRLNDAEMRWAANSSNVEVKHRKLDQIYAIREFCWN